MVCPGFWNGRGNLPQGMLKRKRKMTIGFICNVRNANCKNLENNLLLTTNTRRRKPARCARKRSVAVGDVRGKEAQLGTASAYCPQQRLEKGTLSRPEPRGRRHSEAREAATGGRYLEGACGHQVESLWISLSSAARLPCALPSARCGARFRTACRGWKVEMRQETAWFSVWHLD